MASSIPAIAPVLRVVPEAALQASEKAAAEKKAADQQALTDQSATQLAGYIRQQFEMFKWHRNSQAGWSARLLHCLRTVNGEYDPDKLAQIRQFSGSEVYARLVAMKCRGATALLRDVYLSAERPWGLAPPADPDVPDNIVDKITSLVTMETMTLDQAGQPVDPMMIRDRIDILMDAAREAAKKKSAHDAKIVENKLDELLQEGQFYKALAEFLVDLPRFPFACLKGPIVKIVPTVKYINGRPQVVEKPKMFWLRCSPFDIWWTPGAVNIEDADVIERFRLSRADINDMLELPGYNVEEVRKVLEEYGRGGLAMDWDSTDAERATQENRENPHFNRSRLISGLEYHGNVQGRMLLEYGMSPKDIEDPLRDYMVQAWLIGTHVVKCQLSPSPRKRHPYYITSFETSPGSPIGNGLVDILSDIQDVCNASLRSLVNNMSISSGPQVVVNTDRMAVDADAETLYPWKRWYAKSDPMGNNTQQPVEFFMPTSNANDLLQVYEKFSMMADEISAIPRYMSGGAPGGGAGRTSSGLAMLMSNSGKVLQTVSSNIDRDVFNPLLTYLVDLVMLTDSTGLLTGDEEVRVLGTNIAVQRETQRSRQIEFLQVTANPIDTQIMGTKGRGAVLRSVSQTIGLDGEKIVPSDEELDAMQKAAQAAQQAEAAAQAQGGQQGPAATGDQGPRTNLHQQQPRPQISGGVH